MVAMKSDLAVVSRSVDGVLVSQRAGDGYVNATELCRAAGKLFGDYRRLAATGEFLGELASDMGIPISELIESRKGQSEGQIRGSGQGTWVHPDVAIHLAQWCSAKFAVMVSRWIRELLLTGSVSLNGDYERRFADLDARIDRLEAKCEAGFSQAATAISGLAGVVGGLVDAVKAMTAQQQPQSIIGRRGQEFNVHDRCRFMGWLTTSPLLRAKIRSRANGRLKKMGDVPDVSDHTCYYSGYQLIVLDQVIAEVRAEEEQMEKGQGLFNRVKSHEFTAN